MNNNYVYEKNKVYIVFGNTNIKNTLRHLYDERIMIIKSIINLLRYPGSKIIFKIRDNEQIDLLIKYRLHKNAYEHLLLKYDSIMTMDKKEFNSLELEWCLNSDISTKQAVNECKSIW